MYTLNEYIMSYSSMYLQIEYKCMLITLRHLDHGHTNNAIMQYTLISKLSERAGAE